MFFFIFFFPPCLFCSLPQQAAQEGEEGLYSNQWPEKFTNKPSLASELKSLQLDYSRSKQSYDNMQYDQPYLETLDSATLPSHPPRVKPGEESCPAEKSDRKSFLLCKYFFYSISQVAREEVRRRSDLFGNLNQNFTLMGNTWEPHMTAPVSRPGKRRNCFCHT